MNEENKFDVIIIGAGPGGYVCAIRLAQLGFKTACVESRKTLGGTCLNVGCIPSKALLESSHHYHNALHEFKNHGIELEGTKLNLKEMINRKDGVVNSITSGVDYLFNKNKITHLKGLGRIIDKNTVEVRTSSKKSENFSTKNIVIATGSEPIELPFATFDHDKIIDSTDALSLKSVPKHLIIIGAGVIGLELGSVWKRLGSKVSIVEALDHTLGDMDREISRNLTKELKKEGIEFYLSSKLEKVEKTKKEVIAHCSNNNESFILKGDQLLVAVGRRPVTKGLGLEDLNIDQEKNGTIVVDEKFKTSVDSIYAIGDIIKGPMLAHKASEEGVALAEMLAGQKGHINYKAIPNIVYTWPEVASVGLSEEECKKEERPYNVGKFPFKANGRAKAIGNTSGLVKIISHKQTDELLGVHIVGPSASEIISEVVVAFEYKASAEDLARTIHGHPTLSEAIKEAALDVNSTAIHS